VLAVVLAVLVVVLLHAPTGRTMIAAAAAALMTECPVWLR
jgi:hypothetical protein